MLFVFCTTGIGLLISLLVQTQMAALIITMVVAMIPTILFFRSVGPCRLVNAGRQGQAHLFPAMYYTDIVRGSFLKGVGVEVLWIDLLALAMFAAGMGGLTYQLFTKRPKRHEGRSMTAGRRATTWAQRLTALTWKELLQLSRDVPLLLFVVYSFSLRAGERGRDHDAAYQRGAAGA